MASARISRGNLIFVLFVLLCAALVVVIVLLDRGPVLNYTVVFSEAKDLPVGAPVRLQGVQVGEVMDVRPSVEQAGKMDVSIKIFGQHRRRLHAPPNTTARIKSDTFASGAPFVEVFNRGEEGAGLYPGATIEGLEGWTDEKIWLARDKLGVAMETALVKGRESINKLEAWAASDEGVKLRGEIQAYLISLEGAASEKTGERREKLQAAMTRGKELWRELRAEKAPAAADEVRGSLEALLAHGEELSEEVRAEMEGLVREMEGATTGTMRQ